jgi:hypothetical protein
VQLLAEQREVDKFCELSLELVAYFLSLVLTERR